MSQALTSFYLSESLVSLADACERPVRIASNVMFKIALLLLALMSLPILADIAGRSLFNTPLHGMIELEELCMVLLLFLCLPMTEMHKSHIAIDFLTKKWKLWVNNLLEVAFTVISCGFLVLAGWWAFRQAGLKAANYTPELFIPIWPFLALVGTSMFITAVIAFLNGLRSAASMVKQSRGAWISLGLFLGLLVLAAPIWLPALGLGFSRTAMGVGGWLLMVALIFLRLPLAYAMGIVGAVGLCLISKTNAAGLVMVGIAPYNAMTSFVLVSVPLFILMGEITSNSGISTDLFEAASIWMGRLPGGLAVAAVSGCAGFAAICGESLPTAVTMSSVALPEMKRMKYDDAVACGPLAAGGTLGILIPPSIGFIFYSIVTEQSVGMLFMAGVIPGLMLAGLFILTIIFKAMSNPALAPSAGKTTWAQKFASLSKVVGFLIIFLIIIVGLMTGLMNPTEASGIGCLGALLVAVLRRRFSVRKFIESLEETIKISARLLFILASVGILGYFLALTHLPSTMGDWIVGMGGNRYVTLGIVIAIWVALGCVMNVIPMILLTLPAIYPTIEMLGFDPIWFGVLSVIVMEMGQLTPPVGIVCFAVSSVGKVPLETVFRGMLPYFGCMWAMVILLLTFPELATWLPNYLFR